MIKIITIITKRNKKKIVEKDEENNFRILSKQSYMDRCAL